MTNNNPDNDILIREIADLKFILKAQEEQIQGIRKEADRRVLAITAKYEIGNMLANYKTVYDSLPADAKTNAIKTLVDRELTKQGAEFYIDDNGAFDIRTTAGASLLSENHQRIKAGGFLESVLSQNKLLVGTNDNQEVDIDKDKTKPPKRYSLLKELANQAQSDFDTSGSFSAM